MRKSNPKGQARSRKPASQAAVPPKPRLKIEGYENVLSTFAPGEGPTIAMPLPNGEDMLWKRFQRFGELDEFIKERDQWAKRAAGGVIPEVAGIEGLTRAEASAIYTLHKLAVYPEFPLTEKAARAIIGTPFFCQVAITWLQNTCFAKAEQAFLDAITEGKD